MTRACRDCKWAKLPAFENAKRQAITLNHNCLIACVKLKDVGELAFLKDADGVCEEWEAWDLTGGPLRDCENWCDGYKVHASRALGVRPPDKCLDACPIRERCEKTDG